MTLAIQGPITRDPGPMTLAIQWPHDPDENVSRWPHVPSMRRPPGVNIVVIGSVYRTTKHRSATLPFALVEEPR